MTQTPSSKTNLSHEERTATEPRATGLHSVILKEITKINGRIQTYRFTIKDKGGINVPLPHADMENVLQEVTNPPPSFLLGNGLMSMSPE